MGQRSYTKKKISERGKFAKLSCGHIRPEVEHDKNWVGNEIWCRQCEDLRTIIQARMGQYYSG